MTLPPDIAAATRRYARLFWHDWRNIRSSEMEEYDDLELRRQALPYHFLRALGGVAAERGASLVYYPGAGDDLLSPLVADMAHAVLLDPLYFSGKMIISSPRRLGLFVRRCFDESAHVRGLGRGIACVRFRFRRPSRELTLIRGSAREVSRVRRLIRDRASVYITKGTLQRLLLLPPPTIALIASPILLTSR